MQQAGEGTLWVKGQMGRLFTAVRRQAEQVLSDTKEVNRVAKLWELSGQYRDAAIRLRVGLDAARRRLEQADGVERYQISREIVLLQQMLTEMRDLRRLAEEYYTRPRNWKYTTVGLVAPRMEQP